MNSKTNERISTLVSGVPDHFVYEWVSHAIADEADCRQAIILDLLEGAHVASIVRTVLDECDRTDDRIQSDYKDTLAETASDNTDERLI
jgi:hypothetical protein